ncbi:TOG array regulator of axonemal microtubules protein 1 isoform X2 [Antennarius striatus]|uniref:TOG array regulator of axonemal microtubules protein 1 isoform X2 n=1 Tax=Antennarius striatus TaxID=241820 RepID=UPI0035B3F071
MIPGLIPQELHERLLDLKNYQNRTNGVEELKSILSEVDMKSVPSRSIEEFINFLVRLLDDSNFKVLYGTLQVLNLLIQKLQAGVDKYFKQIVSVTLKVLGDTRTVTRNEYLNVFRQLMKTVEPQKVLDLITGNLKHKNSRVREDVLTIILAAMLTHPRKEFNVPKLCFEVAPCLVDSKRKVRYATLELFAVFDYCLDMGKKQPLMKAVDMVELNEDAEGLMAAVQARRARHILPKLSSDGTVEYGLVVPKLGQWCSPHSGADLDWVMNGGRISSARSHRTEPDCDPFHGCGSLTDDVPHQRRIVSAGKGKNKLPWEMFSVSTPENNQRCSTPSGKYSEQVAGEDFLPLSRKLSPETYVPSFSSAEPQKSQSSRRQASPAALRRSGSLNLDPDIFKTTSLTDTDVVAPKGRMLSRNPSVERTFSLPSNPTPSSASSSSSFLLPSYPLATLPGGILTPTLSRRCADSSLSTSNTWPNKKESSPHQRDSSPWRDTASTAKGDDLWSRCSPRPLRASLVSSSSTSSFRRALSSTRATLSVSPVTPTAEHVQFHNGQQSHAPGSPQSYQLEKSLHLDFDDGVSAVQAPQEDDPLDMQEMLNSLRFLRNSAAKKRAKASGNSSELDLDSPDSAVRLDLALDSSTQTPPMLTSSASESGLSSLSSGANTRFNGKTSSGNSSFSGVKRHVARVPSSKLRSSVSMDFSSLQGLGLRNEVSSEVGVIGQRVIYSNGTIKSEEEAPGMPPPLLRPAARESFRALKPAKGSQGHSSRSSTATDKPEGVVGRESPSFPGVSLSLDQGSPVSKPSTDPSSGNYSDALPGSHRDSDDSPLPNDVKLRLKNSRTSRDLTWLQSLDQQEGRFSQGEKAQEKIRHRVRQMLSASPTEDSRGLLFKELHLNGSTLTSPKADPLADELSISPTSSVSPSGPQSPTKSFTPPHQPSPPAVPPTTKNLSRLRRAPSLSRTRPSLSHSSDELSPAATAHKKNPAEPLELCPIAKPDLALMQSFDLLNSENWEKKIEGMTLVRSLALYHSDSLHGRLHDICLALIQEVKNLRSGVSRFAVCTLGDLFTHMHKAMDLELEGTVKALLQKSAEINSFIKQDVNGALDSMVQHCTPTRGISALLSGGLSHINAVVRNCMAQHLVALVEKVGPIRLLSGGTELTDRILPAVTKLAQDSSQEARYFGRQMLLCLSSHPDFDKILEKYILTKDLPTVRDIVFTLKTKGLEEMPQDTQSARGRRSVKGSGTVRASSLTREPLNQTNRESNSHYSRRSQTLKYQSVADKAEYVKQISGLLGSKDFRERIKGIDQLTADCQQNPNIVINSIFPVFDAFRARLQESNSKVNLYALESLQKIIHLLKNNLSQVVNILVPAVVDNHLNSKNNTIYSAAIGAINALILHLDNLLLLQPFCTKAQFLNGKAKVDLVEKVADLATELYPRKPRIVEQKVLPLLWHLLGTSTHSGTIHGRGGSVRAATANLCQALYSQMGQSLLDCAASQPANVHKSLNEVLRTSS